MTIHDAECCVRFLSGLLIVVAARIELIERELEDLGFNSQCMLFRLSLGIQVIGANAVLDTDYTG